MTDVEKVLQAVEHCDLCSDMPNCPECAYLREPDCMEMLKRDIITLLKVREPLSVTHLHEEYSDHLWKKDENGNVDEWAMEFDYHQGPVCERCGHSFCIHCEPNGYMTHKKCVVDKYKCPKCWNGLWRNQKYCDKCGQEVKWGE